uniref:Uncharacterized protein n=1 Tax=Setaria digitata TaxID=48799 RepID=A0A915PQ85_9BILA
MLRDLFHHLFPNTTVQQLLYNIQDLKQQIVSAQVRLVILKDTDLEEKELVVERIVALEAEMEQEIFLLVVATEHDEVHKCRTVLEKEDTTYGPLYRRVFKPRQIEQHWKVESFYPPYLQHPPLYQTPPPCRIILFGNAQNPVDTSCRFFERCPTNFNMHLYNNPPKQTVGAFPSIPVPDVMGFKSSMMLQLPEPSVDMQLPLHFTPSPERQSEIDDVRDGRVMRLESMNTAERRSRALKNINNVKRDYFNEEFISR